MKFFSPLLNNSHFYNFVQLVLGMDIYKVISKEIEKYPNSSIVDIGCGTGQILQYLRPREYLGLDINAKYLEQAETKFGRENIKFKNSDARNMPKLNRSYELVLIVNFIHHLDDKGLEKTLKGIKNNIKFNKFILVDSKPDFGIFTKLLEMGDQGNYFRGKEEIEKFLSRA